jgi:hypothetical protein
VPLKPNGTLLLRDQLPPTLIESKPFSEIQLNSTESRGVDAREAVKALIVANHYLGTELEKLRAAVSMGYASA